MDAADVQVQPPPITLQSDVAQKALPLNVERAIRRRLERQREAKVLHRVEPRTEAGYPVPEKAATLPAADVARRARHKTEAGRKKRRDDAKEKKTEKPTPKLPEKVIAAQPSEPLPEVGPRRIRQQADDLRRQMAIASLARRKVRREKDEK